jgi:hypothetical protein
MWIELHLYGTGERALINIDGIGAVVEGHRHTAWIATSISTSGGSDFHVNESYDDVVSAIIRRNCGGVE